jgi:hypothetical protein
VLAIISAGCGSGSGNDGADDDGADASIGSDGANGDDAGDDAYDGVDASVSIDASVDAAVATQPVACGDTTCRVDQTCVDGACVFDCPAGAAHVPGDYATAQEAFTALDHVGGVICLGPLVEVAPQFGGFWLYPTASLTVIGSGPSATRLIGELDINDASDHDRVTPFRVEMRGLSVEGGLALILHAPYHDDLVVEDVRVRGAVRYVDRMALMLDHNGGSNVMLDGLDVSSPTGTAVGFYPNSISNPPVTPIVLRNSWIHDSVEAISVDDGYGLPTLIANNTLSNTMYGIYGRGTNQLTYANNVFDRVQYTQVAFVSPGTRHHNAYLSSGTAQTPPGMTDIVVDVSDLDASASPSAPTATSRLRGAADPALAPATDYWGNPRGATPDIGAVEGW